MPMLDCDARLEGELLILENSRLRRRYAWNEGHLISQQLVDRVAGRTWELDAALPDCTFPGLDVRPEGGSLDVIPRPATSFKPAHLEANVLTRLGTLEVRRSFRIYPGCPAIACDVYLRGRAPETWAAEGDPPLPSQAAVVVERIAIPSRHLRLECVQFFDITDRRNNLVAARSILPYRHEDRLAGNLLLVRNLLSEEGLFILKEAPCSDVQLAWPGYDFTHRLGPPRTTEIKLAGLGILPQDVREDEWVRGYGFVTGVASGAAAGDIEYALLAALRSYQGQVRIHQPGRDHMVLLNTWGDRGQDTKIGESFAVAELERAAHLGVTHFQLDDGWQSGHSSNSAFPGGSLDGIWKQDDYWAPHPQRFPRGLTPVVERSKALGIELCLWFNPSKDDSYRHWREDADALIALNRAYGIRTFKIDGVSIPDKQADLNLRAMLERVMEATSGEAVFNMDVTAGRRWGYHYGNDYGNVFLENRYSDWRNYYPHWTLRNLWMLSRYVPPQNLQIEFLNKWRNADNYESDDPLAPARIPFEYCFAITMMAQPLAWFEATGLPEEAFGLAPTIKTYRAHQERIHAGQILPIGEEPSGASWTGFQSLQGNRGYLAVYREHNDRPRARLRLWALAGQTVECDAVLGRGAAFTALVAEDGRLEFHLPEPFTYALYRYRVLEG
jgi:alpha-galactosidase